MKKTILITGGFGFLGGRLGQYLSENYNVILGSRSDQSKPNWLSIAKTLKIDWDDETSLNDACNLVDIVIHASGLNAQECSSGPEKALLVNGVYTQNLVKAAINQSVKKFIYLSTAHVYSDSLLGVITEDTPTANTHPYATSHRAGEDVVRYAHVRNKIEGIVIRLSNSFGAPAHIGANCWMLLVNDLCVQAITTGDNILQSSETQIRDFITITDVCRSIEHIIKLPENKLSNGLFNVGGEWSPTILEVAQLVSNRLHVLTGKKIQIQAASLQMNQPIVDLNYVTEKINKTGFELTSNLNDEIDNLIRFCIKHYEI